MTDDELITKLQKSQYSIAENVFECNMLFSSMIANLNTPCSILAPAQHSPWAPDLKTPLNKCLWWRCGIVYFSFSSFSSPPVPPLIKGVDYRLWRHLSTWGIYFVSGLSLSSQQGTACRAYAANKHQPSRQTVCGYYNIHTMMMAYIHLMFIEAFVHFQHVVYGWYVCL